MSNNVEIEMGPMRIPNILNHFKDFANIMKAFIGSNYLTIAFAFSQSGLALGLIGLVIIASMTAHCCHLLVKCKYHALRILLSKDEVISTQEEDIMNYSSSGSSTSSDEEMDKMEDVRKRLLKCMTYGDVGRLCMGKLGVTLVNASIFITQFGFCVGYCIFIGNTMNSMFPLFNCSIAVTNSSQPTAGNLAQHCEVITHINSLNSVHVDMSDMIELGPGMLHSRRALPMLNDHKNNSSAKQLDNISATTFESFLDFLKSGNMTVISSIPPETTGFLKNVTSAPISPAGTTVATNVPDTTVSDTTTSTSAHSNTTMFPVLSSTTINPLSNITKWVLTRQKHIPDLKLLVISPLLIFIAMSMFRDVRQMGYLSSFANLSIFLGCIMVLTFLIHVFKMSSTYQMFDWKHLPIFFGMVTSSFEGIGTILPIEGSMEGNRHNFVRFLYGAVGILTAVLATFGILGYLCFGADTQQMLNANIPHGHGLSIAINSCLCIGVLLTFPLMIFPVVNLSEKFVFGNGGICGPKPDDKRVSTDHQALLPKKEVTFSMPVAEKISDMVPTWKRNSLRIFIVLCAGGFAVLLRNYFAYISAFVGALGSTMLAYILPCLFHLKLCWSELPLAIKIKDIIIIIIGIATGLAGIYAVLSEIFSSM